MIENFQNDLKNLLEEFKERLKNVKSYKFALHWLESFNISVYNKKYSLKSLSSISQINPLKYKIEPWDINILQDIERDVKKTNFGGSVQREKNFLIVNFPPITEETKKEFLKNISQLKEEFRIRSRKLRDEFLKRIKENKENGKISEDLFYKTKEKIDKEIEEFNKKLENFYKEKEKELIS